MRHATPADAGSRSPSSGQERDESTLFSLRSLAARAAPPPTGKGTASRDDSGLIDLAALAATQERAERPKLDVAPFAAVGLFDAPVKEPEPVPPPPEQLPARARKGKTIALLAGAATVVAAASAIAIATTRGGGEARIPPVAAVHTATVPVAPPPEPPKTTAPASTGTETAATAATATSRPVQGPPRRNPRPLGTAVVKDPPKPPPACDLMCQMQKSVGKPR